MSRLKWTRLDMPSWPGLRRAAVQRRRQRIERSRLDARMWIMLALAASGSASASISAAFLIRRAEACELA